MQLYGLCGGALSCCLLAGLLTAQDPKAALDKAIADLDSKSNRTQDPPAGATPTTSTPSALRLLDLSLDGLFSVGTSTVRDAALRNLQGSDHDPRKRGFTLQQLELSGAAAVDPWFQAETHIVYSVDPENGDSRFELEEAFATTTGLPRGWQVKAGHFFTEFGRHNAQHPHAWDWQNAPVAATRVFGPDGMRGTGARISWIVPVPVWANLTFGVQNSNGETMASFGSSSEAYEERPLGGRLFEERTTGSFRDLAWHGRFELGGDLSDTWNAAGGTSFAWGGNALGAGSASYVYGADLTLRWRPENHFRGWPFVKLSAECILRDAEAGAQIDENDPAVSGDEVTLPAATLRDRGFWVQGLWGFSYGWAAGLRWDWATAGGGDTYSVAAHAFGPRSDDPFRDDRTRLSPLLVWHASEFSRLRLQYDYDRADHLPGGEAHSLWLGFEFMIGAHPAHKY